MGPFGLTPPEPVRAALSRVSSWCLPCDVSGGHRLSYADLEVGLDYYGRGNQIYLMATLPPPYIRRGKGLPLNIFIIIINSIHY